MTREEFENLVVGEVLLSTVHKNKSGDPVRWKVNGKMQGSLKTGSAKWPLKHGLYSFDYLTLNDIHLLNREGKS